MSIELIIVCVIFGLFFIFALCGIIIETVKRIKLGKDDISNESAGDSERTKIKNSIQNI